MNIDLGRIVGRTLSICWRHKWLWVLGVFGGGAGIGAGFRGGFNFSPGGGRRRPTGLSAAEMQAIVSAWVHDHALLIAAIVTLVLLLIVISFLITCVAVPASVWAALRLDAEEPATLGTAWREGVARFWIYLRLYLLRLLISLTLLAVAGLLAGVGFLVYTQAGTPSLVVLIPLGVLLGIVWLIVSLLISFFFVWSERTALILDVGAVDALRSSAWLARRSWLDTLIFAFVMGLAVGAVAIVATLAAIVVAVPGIVVAIVGFSTGNVPVAAVGIAWITILGGVVFLAGVGFAGSLVQVSYALACRDLCQRWGLQLAPEAPVPSPRPSLALSTEPPAPA